MKLKYVALWIAALCSAVFVVQLFFGTEPFVLVNELKFVEPWRILTALFAHANLEHLVANLSALVLFGLVLEGRIGPRRVFWLFIISGIAINLFSPYDRSLGASGAIFAILGTLVVLRPLMMVWVYGMPVPMIVAGLIWLGIDLFGVFYPSSVANLAHIAGLGSGIVVGFVWRKRFGDTKGRKIDEERDELVL